MEYKYEKLTGFRMIVPEYCNSTFDNEFMTAEETYRYYNSFMWKTGMRSV